MNYRPASVLPPVSKFFEKLMQKQINEHIKKTNYLLIYVDTERVSVHSMLYYLL